MIFTAAELDDMAILLGVQKLELFVKPEWGAQALNHSSLIKLDLGERTYKKFETTDASISHAEGLGGYALIHYAEGEDLRLGFDIEIAARVRPEVAARICEHDDEFKAAPSPAALWSAKEAGFKCFKGPDQPPVIPYLVVHSWKRKSQYETFEISHRQTETGLKAWGLTFQKDVYQFAIARRSP